MNQTKSKWLAIALILLSLAFVTTAVAANDMADSSVKRQIVQELINHFAEPECTASAAQSQQKTFDAFRPVADCWLVKEAYSAPDQIQNKGVQNER